MRCARGPDLESAGFEPFRTNLDLRPGRNPPERAVSLPPLRPGPARAEDLRAPAPALALTLFSRGGRPIRAQGKAFPVSREGFRVSSRVLQRDLEAPYGEAGPCKR